MAWSIRSDPIDRAVRQFMAEEGIDVNRVLWYRVGTERGKGARDDVTVLELKVMMNDKTGPIEPAEEQRE